MNKRSLGNKPETLACEKLVAEGFRVWRPSAPRFFKPHSSADILGVFDIVATREGETRWIQVRTARYMRKAMVRAIEAVPVLGRKEYWLYHDGEFTIKEIK